VIPVGAVEAHRSGGFERWFPAQAFSPEERVVISALRVRGQRAILTHLLGEGAARFAGLLRATALSSATLARYLQRMTADGVVEMGSDRLYRLRDPEVTRMRLALYRRRFPDLLADAAQEIFEETL